MTCLNRACFDSGPPVRIQKAYEICNAVLRWFVVYEVMYPQIGILQKL